MDERLARPLGAVLRDLAGDGIAVEIRDEDWTGDPDFPSCWFVDGASGYGMTVQAGLTAPERLVDVADRTQDWAVEWLCSRGRPTEWPACPRHPRTHPLTAGLREGRASWSCPRGEAIALIGHLHDHSPWRDQAWSNQGSRRR